MAMHPKKSSESCTRMTQLVMPDDTNNLGNLRGGKLLHWMDLAAAIAAQRHSGRVVVTAAVDFVQFKSPIKQNEVVTLIATVTRAFTTSMEVRVDVKAEQPVDNIPKRDANTAYYTFVAVDQGGRPIPVPAIEPETDLQRAWYEAALSRRELRLEMAKRD